MTTIIDLAESIWKNESTSCSAGPSLTVDRLREMMRMIDGSIGLPGSILYGSKKHSTASEIEAKMQEARPVYEHAAGMMKGAVDKLTTSLLQVISSPYCYTREQFRFPKSKRKRIRKKWAKREENFRLVPRAFIVQGDKLVAYPSIVAQMQREMAVRVDNIALRQIVGETK